MPMVSAPLNDLFRDATRAAQAGDRAQAATLLAEAIDRGLASRAPLPSKAFFQLGVVLMELGRLAQAEHRVPASITSRSLKPSRPSVTHE